MRVCAACSAVWPRSTAFFIAATNSPVWDSLLGSGRPDFGSWAFGMPNPVKDGEPEGSLRSCAACLSGSPAGGACPGGAAGG